jgi:DNA-binding PadR family transcriptional regulator
VERRTTLSLNEWAVLSLLAEEPRHGYDIAGELRAGRPLGNVWRVGRPLVYRALERLVALGYVEEARTEKGDAAPPRTVYAPTHTGRATLTEWLATPAEHLRDVRSVLLLKLVVHQRLGSDPGPLVAAQRAAFAPRLLERAGRPSHDDVIGLWRHHSADAVRRFLDDLDGP